MSAVTVQSKRKAARGSLQAPTASVHADSITLPGGKRMLGVTAYAVVNIYTRKVRCVYDDRWEAYQQKNVATERVVKLTGSVVLPKWA